MSFMESIRTCFGGFQDFSGRATRSEFWWFQLFLFITGILASVLSFVIPYLEIVVAVLLLLPSLAVSTRRLHDTNHTGAWLVVPVILWLGTLILRTAYDESGYDLLLWILLAVILGVLVVTVALLVFLIRPGTAGSNQYGPDPLAKQDVGGFSSRGSGTIPNVREDDTSRSRFCTSCGKELQAGARFCNACGTAV